MVAARFALAGSGPRWTNWRNGGNHFEAPVAALVTSGNGDLRHPLHECGYGFNQRRNWFGSAQRQTAKRQLFPLVAVASNP